MSAVFLYPQLSRKPQISNEAQYIREAPRTDIAYVSNAMPTFLELEKVWIAFKVIVTNQAKKRDFSVSII